MDAKREVLTALTLTDNPNAKNAYEISGGTPAALVANMVEKEYVMCGITVQEFIDTHGAPDFNLTELQNDFTTICTDYKEPLTANAKSKAVEFCSKVIYEIGPASRKGDKKQDKLWKLRFPEKSADGTSIVVRCAFIATYRFGTYKKDYENGVRICLTVKQAGLLAMNIFDKLAKYAIALPDPICLLTPLAGAVFSKDEIPKIADGLKLTTESTIIIINNSCQSGGQHLENSSIACAIVSCISATRNIKEESTTRQIIGKTIKQYLAANKVFNESAFMVYAMYAQAGVPSHMNVESLIRTFTQMQDPSKRSLIKAQKESEGSSKSGAPAEEQEQK